MIARPDPKPERKRGNRPRRHIDRDVGLAALLSRAPCWACGRPSANADHIIPRGAPHFGDDHPDNLALLCGSGTAGCHGAKHGSPYVDEAGRRWTTEDVMRAIGEEIARRPPVQRYIFDKLGEGPGREFLRRHYYLEVE